MNWTTIIRQIAPNAKANIVAGLAAAMPEVISIAKLTTSQRQAQFLAQIAHESDGFRTAEEYASGREYEGRRDLGNTQPGDGVRFKGRGLIQLTGRSNYSKYGREMGVDLISNPEQAADFPYAALSAAHFWIDRNLNRLADQDDIKGITKRVNGGYNGLASRESYYKRAVSALDYVRRGQARLRDLNYPLGKVDGEVGPLTRSSIRDFQDAAGLHVTGEFDDRTINRLMADDAPRRPVSEDRVNMTAADLRAGGSEIAQGAFSAKIGVAGAAIGSAAQIADQASGIAGNVQSIADGIRSGMSIKDIIFDYWWVLLWVVLGVVVGYFLYLAYKGACKAERSRLENAKNGSNVRL